MQLVIKLSLFQPMSFLAFPLLILSPKSLGGVSEWLCEAELLAGVKLQQHAILQTNFHELLKGKKWEWGIGGKTWVQSQKVATVYPVETNSRDGKLHLVLETVMTIGPGFFQIFLEQDRFFTNYIATSYHFTPAMLLKPPQCLISYLLQESLALLSSLTE